MVTATQSGYSYERAHQQLVMFSALDLSTARAGSEFHAYKTPSHTPSSMTSIKVIKRVVSTIKQSTQLT